MRRLHAAGQRLPFGLTVLAFGDEEGVRFPSTLTGSAAVAGRFDAKILDEKDEDGMTRRAALAEFGAPEGDPAAPWQGQSGLGYLEIHIEQGPVLEAENRPGGWSRPSKVSRAGHAVSSVRQGMLARSRCRCGAMR